MKKLELISIFVLMVTTTMVQAVPLVDSSQYSGLAVKAPKTTTVSVGFQFTTGATATDITHLGFIDIDNNDGSLGNADGLQSAQTVAIWDETTATKVAEVTVGSGTAGILNDNFRYAALASAVTLNANTSYVIAANVGQGLDSYKNATSSTVNAPFVDGSSSWEVRWQVSETFEMPTGTANWGDGMTYGIVNAIPEPATLALFGLGSFVVSLKRRRKS